MTSRLASEQGKHTVGNREECLFEGEEGVEFCQKTLQDPKNLKFQYLIFLNVLRLFRARAEQNLVHHKS